MRLIHVLGATWRRIATASAAVATALLCALVLAACGDDDSGGGGTEERGGAPASGAGGGQRPLTMAVQEVPTSLDTSVYQATAMTPLQAVGAPYVYFGEKSVEGTDVMSFDPSKFEPGVAESWEIDPGKSVTIKLRQGVKSPYGNELTTADVEWITERNNAIEGAIGGAFFYAQGGIDPEKPLEVIDKYTFKYNLVRESPNLMRALNLVMVMPFDSTEAKKHATEADPWAEKWLTENTAFFGPYQVADFTPGQSMTLEPNPNWYGGEVPMNRIVIRSIPDPSTRQQLVQSGQVQFAPDLPRVQLAEMEGNNRVKVQYGRSSRQLYLLMNTKAEPWSDVRVRQAVAAALPAAQINQEAYRDTATLSAGPVSPLFEDHDPATWEWKEVDVDRARQLLQEAGEGDGFSARLQYSLSNPGPENAQVAIAIQNALREIGIEVQLQRAASDAAYFADLIERKIEFGLGGVAAFLPDAGYAMANTTADGPSGFSDYSDKEFLDKLKEANGMVDGPERTKLLTELQKQWSDDVAMYPIVEPNVGAAMAPDLNGFNIQSTGFPLLHKMRFGDAPA